MPSTIDIAQEQIKHALEKGQQTLSEYDSRTILEAYGIPVVKTELVHDAAEVERTAARLGYPVVVKACGAAFAHKSDRGLVRLNVDDATSVATAIEDIRKAAGPDAIDGYLVQPMLRGRREIIVGGMRDPLFGPCVMLGLGGILVEAIADITFRLAPLDERDAQEMINNIRAQRVFDAVRGEPAADRGALIKVLMAVGQILIDHPRIAQIDVNPLIFEGTQPVAVDALITLGKDKFRNPQSAIRNPTVPSIADMKQKYHALFEPSSVAIVGASSSPLKWGFRILFNTIMGGYKGALYAVNPKHKEIVGIDCYPSISALPEPIDLAMIVLPPQFVVDGVRECVACGVKAAVVITAGFGEIEDEAARAAEKEMAAIAAEGGMLLVGPNCAGIASPDPNSLYSGMLYRYPSGGGLSVVSQSGNVGMTVLTWAQLHQVGVARFVSSGNEAATRCEDYLQFYAHDAKTKAILVYVEGTRDGRRLFDALRETAARKPVVVVKGGRSDAGQKAAASHTGALASTVALFEAACRQAGATVVDDIYQAMELASAFVNQPLPRGHRVVVVSEGGGWGVMGADACAAAGLDVIDLPEDVLRDLDAILPGWWSRGNPVDLVAGNDRTLMSRTIETVLKSPEVDAVLVLGIGYMCSRSARLRTSEFAQKLGVTRLIEAATNMELHDVQRISGLIDLYEKPIITASDTVMLAYGPVPNEAIAEMERLGVYAYASPINAAKTLAHMAERYEFLYGIPRGRR